MVSLPKLKELQDETKNMCYTFLVTHVEKNANPFAYWYRYIRGLMSIGFYKTYIPQVTRVAFKVLIGIPPGNSPILSADLAATACGHYTTVERRTNIRSLPSSGICNATPSVSTRKICIRDFDHLCR